MYKINKYSVHLPEYGVLTDSFSKEEVDKIIFLEKILKFEKGAVGHPAASQVDNKARNSKVAFLPIDPATTEWVWQKLGAIIPKVNYDLFMRDIEAIEALQYTIYSSRDNQFYDWHLDSHDMYTDFERKISGVLVLSDPEEYEGGEFELIPSGDPTRSEKFKAAKGEIIFFSSRMPHKVHPVTKGTRKSLVFWVLGKREV